MKRREALNRKTMTLWQTVRPKLNPTQNPLERSRLPHESVLVCDQQPEDSEDSIRST